MIDIWGSRILLKTGFLKTVLIAGSVLLYAKDVAAQTPPDAGAVRQEIEKETAIPTPKPKKDSLLAEPPKEMKAAPAGLSVTVNSFRFAGNSVLSEDDLNAAVAAYLERPLTFPELEMALVDVSETYKNAGWVARAFFPQQDIDSGVVQIQVVEAKFGEVRINGAQPERVKSERVLGTVAKSLKQGELLSASDLDVGLRRVNELPGVAVTAVLAAGKNVGETDVLINAKDGPETRATVSLDNHGSRFTGEGRLIGSLMFDSPFRLGEQITATLLHASGTDYGQLMGTLPIGYSGLRVGAQASILDYEIIEDFDDLGAEGESTSLGLTASYPLLLSRKRNLSLSSALTETSFLNETDLTESEYKVSALNITLLGYTFDELAGGGVNQASLSLSAGDASYEPEVNKDPLATPTPSPAAEVKSEGGFAKVRYMLSRQQRIASKFTLYAALSGQFASGPLSSSEKFQQGGATGLRAYTSSDGSGDEGHMLNLEFRVPLPHNFDVTAFYDFGRIIIDAEPEPLPPPGNTEVTILDEYSLQGAGLAAAWYSKSGLNVKAAVAATIGDNDLAKASGTEDEQDDYQLWLQVSKSF